MAGSSNGWRSGRDPTVRALRITAVVGIIGLLVWWVVFDETESAHVGALLIGFLLLALFGDLGVSLPWLTAERRREWREQERDDDESRSRMDDEEWP